MKLQQKLSNGRWDSEFESDKRAQMFIGLAVQIDQVVARNLKREPKTREDIIADLSAGMEVPYGADWYAAIRDGEIAAARLAARKAKPVNEIRCDCGHTSAHPMTTARGTACPDCYDRMSN